MKKNIDKILRDFEASTKRLDALTRKGAELFEVMYSALTTLEGLQEELRDYISRTGDTDAGRTVEAFDFCKILSMHQRAQEAQQITAECVRNAYEIARMKPGEITATQPEQPEPIPHYSKNNEARATREYNNLKKGGYLAPGTLLSDWLYIYGVEGAEAVTSPIKWQRTQTELAHLVRLTWQDTDTKMWVICAGAFLINGKRPNIPTMKTELSRIERGAKEKPMRLYELEAVLKSGGI